MAWLAAVRVVAITDRHRMVPAALLAGGDWRAIADAFGEAIVRALDGVAPEAVAIQVREKDLDGGPLLLLVRAAVAAAHPARVLVNDRVDVAVAAGAHGVHLPEHGLSIADTRAFPGFADRVVGVSRHQAGEVSGADLVQLGPIFATPNKGPPLGLAALATPTTARLVAVGGIATPEHARAAIAAGARAVAVIRAAWSGSLAAITAATSSG